MGADDSSLSAQEAADLLGVSRPTLYAYVSRGLVVSEPGPGPTRARRYPRGRRRRSCASAAPAAATRRWRRTAPLHWGTPVLDSALTMIEAAAALLPRARRARPGAQRPSFEEVAALLWTGPPRTRRTSSRPAPPRPRRPRTATPWRASCWREGERAVAGVAALGEAAPRRAGAVVQGLFASAGARGRGPLGRRLARGWRRPLGRGRRHGGSGAVRRPRPQRQLLHRPLRRLGGRAPRVGAAGGALRAARPPPRRDGRARRRGCWTRPAATAPARPSPGRCASRAPCPASATSSTRPATRAAPSCCGAPAPPRTTRRSRPWSRSAGASCGLEPTLDLGLVALCRAHRLPDAAPFCLFALGRSAGWAAHAIEAAADARLIRPRSRYTGPSPADLVG